MDFKNATTISNELPVFTSAIIHKLTSAIAMGNVAEHDGVTYSPAQVAQMLKNQSAGIKPTKTSIYAGDFCMTQGAIITPPPDNDSDYVVKPAAPGIDIPFNTLPVTGGVVDLQDVKIGTKRYYLPVDVKEDIKIFASLFKYADSPMLQRRTWVYIPSTNSVWSENGFYSRNIPFQVLDNIRLDRTMAGQDLIEYIYLNKALWPLIRTVVWSMLKDVTVPSLDEEGQEIYDSDDDLELEYANGDIDVIQGDSKYCFLDRLTRPAPVMFKCSADKYTADMQIDKAKEQVGCSTLLETHNDYFDGIDYSINCNNIRNKLTVLANLDLFFLPSPLGIVTNQVEEFNVVSKYFATAYAGKVLVHLTERSAHNYSGFKLFMKPTSSQRVMDIHDKAVVSRSMQKNSSLIRSIRANDYPIGFGFMTALLVEHYLNGQEPTEKKGPGKPSDYVDLEGGYCFKQLHSASPLTYFPYVIWTKEVVEAAPSRVINPIDNIRKHLWTLVNYPVTRQTYCSLYPTEAKPVTVEWTPGKTANTIMFELDAEFVGDTSLVKAGRKIVKPKEARIKDPKPVVHIQLPPERKQEPVQIVKMAHVPPASAPLLQPPIESPSFAEPPPVEEKKEVAKPKAKKKIAMRRKQVEVDASELNVNDDSDVD